jgi:hypothetical protein
VAGEGPGWVLHYRSEPSDSEGLTAFFPGMALTDEKGAISAAFDFLSDLEGA